MPQKSQTLTDIFHDFAKGSAAIVGSPWAFFLAILVIIAWLATGPTFHYSDTWQLMINTSTTIVTFLIVFLIQNTQNRDARALHLKLDEVIRALRGAHNEMIDIEKLSDAELHELAKRYERLRRAYELKHTNKKPA